MYEMRDNGWVVQVQWGGVCDEDEGEECDVCGGFIGKESMAVLDLHDISWDFSVVAYAVCERRPCFHLQVLGQPPTHQTPFFLFFWKFEF